MSRSPAVNVQETLRRLGIVPKRSRGQNFLTDGEAAGTIVAFAALQTDEAVLEVGPGLGVITQWLGEMVEDLSVVEVDPVLAENLRQTLFQGREKRVHQLDIRDLKLETLRQHEGQKFVIVSNVPYSISTEFVLWVLENRSLISRASLLLQREFAERLAAPPGGRSYGALSVLREVFAEAELGGVIPGTAFYPVAAVESRLVRIIPRSVPKVSAEYEASFRQVVKAAFSARRKTLLNSLFGAGLFATKELGIGLLTGVGIDPVRRAETLSVEEFLKLADGLSAMKGGVGEGGVAEGSPRLLDRTRP